VSALASPYDTVAHGFERQRALPDEAAHSVRRAVLMAVGEVDRPLILDLGAGTGRIGWPFVAAGDDYVGVDLSDGMLRVFADRRAGGKRAMLARADGLELPFASASFDAVLMVQVFGDLGDWRRLVLEARRVVRRRGILVLGRTAAPIDGIDERMKQHLDRLLDERAVRPERQNRREDAARYLAAVASETNEVIAATWLAERSPGAFLDRHAGGVRFSRLPQAAREDALRALRAWAQSEFGSLDKKFTETYRFEMQLFSFAGG
jgi:ubiquinone/menaquinone biosynthesis C-methylase UbiE